MKLTAFCMPWHVLESDAFQHVLVHPLRGLIEIMLTAWDETPDVPLRLFAQDPKQPLLFCQLPPPVELLRQAKARVVWLPMWDSVVSWPMDFWRSLPKNLRIVAFSDPVERLAKRHGLPTLRLRFFLDPDQAEPVRWHGDKTMLYWNRMGLYSLGALQRICRDLGVEQLIHVFRPDPRYAYPDLALPASIGRTRVTTIRSFLSGEEHRRLLSNCPLVLAPRPLEGIGLAVLQSMVRGACVLAYDGPSMNEYITHGRSGYLFHSYSRRIHAWRRSLFKRWRRWMQPRKTYWYHMVDTGQIKPDLQRIDPARLGAHARAEHEQGYARWSNELETFGCFLTQW